MTKTGNARWLVGAAVLWTVVAGGAIPVTAAEPPRVVVSIKPVHALVAGVMDGIGAPHLLLDGASSPHTFTLRPSDARVLNRADLVFWIGPELETFLPRALSTLSRKARTVALAEAPAINHVAARELDAWDANAAGASTSKAKSDHRHHHDHGENPHIWLDPRNAIAMVRAIVTALVEADPANAAIYRTNGAESEARLIELDRELEGVLSPLAGRPYVIFHDAYAHLEARYGLSPAGAITISPEVLPGTAHLTAMRQRIRELETVCVFAEPQFEPKLLRALTAGTEARIGLLDPIGAALPAGREMYGQLMRRNARALGECLAVAG